MSKSKFKYHIQHQISLLPREISISHVEKTLLKDHGINRDAFYRDRNITIDSDASIPSDRLDAYAVVFGVTADELKNYKIKGKSLIEKFSSKARAGLKALIILIIALLLSSCAATNYTCADFAQGKGSKNRNYAASYRKHFSHHDTSIKKITLPRI